MRHCPYCNNDMTNGQHTLHGRVMYDSGCDYKGPGITTEERTEQARGVKLGDMTGEPRNNGWADGMWGNDGD